MRRVDPPQRNIDYTSLPFELMLVTMAVGLALVFGSLQGNLRVMGGGAIALGSLLPVAFLLRLEHQLCILIAALLGTRLFTLIGAPASIAYGSYGLMLVFCARVAYEKLIVKRSSTYHSRLIYSITLLFLGAVILSAAVNKTNPFFASMSILVWVGPFIVFAALRDMGIDERRRAKSFLVFILCCQIPIAFFQFIKFGTGDPVQGTLIGQGAGAHVIGAVCLLGIPLLFVQPKLADRFGIISASLAFLLLSVSVLSDAKQVLAAAVVACGIVVWPLLRSSLIPVVLGLCILVILATVANRVNPYMWQIISLEKFEDSATKKLAFAPVVEEMSTAVSLVVGAGPGNGASRVASLRLPEVGNLPNFLLDNTVPQIAVALLDASDDIIGAWGTSTASPFTSWLSVFSDLGVLGLGIYILLGIVVWRSFAQFGSVERFTASALLLMAVILGGVSTWLEEPVYTTVLAVALGSITSSRVTEKFSKDAGTSG